MTYLIIFISKPRLASCVECYFCRSTCRPLRTQSGGLCSAITCSSASRPGRSSPLTSFTGSSKYRQKNVKEAPNFHEEGGWGNWKNVLMTLLVTGTVLGFVEYQTFASTNLINPPGNADPPLYINVTGQQFVWIFTYPNGHTTFDNLTVPVDQIIVLNITSVDVDHSFTIPSLSVAKDAIPGQYNFLWFNATTLGTVTAGIRCKELCGVGHATMIGNLNVLSQSAYNKWYAGTSGSSSSSTTSSSVSGNGQTATIDHPIGSRATGSSTSPRRRLRSPPGRRSPSPTRTPRSTTSTSPSVPAGSDGSTAGRRRRT